MYYVRTLDRISNDAHHSQYYSTMYSRNHYQFSLTATTNETSTGIRLADIRGLLLTLHVFARDFLVLNKAGSIACQILRG